MNIPGMANIMTAGIYKFKVSFGFATFPNFFQSLDKDNNSYMLVDHVNAINAKHRQRCEKKNQFILEFFASSLLGLINFI